MSQGSLEHLLNIEAGPHWARLARESIWRVLSGSLDPSESELFFPGAQLMHGEKPILERYSRFAEAGAIDIVMQYLAQEQNVPENERKRIDAERAAVFFSACTTPDPPRSPHAKDPVVQYGWDRFRDMDVIYIMQAECKELYLACRRLAFITAAPEMAQYMHNNPARCYDMLVDRLRSDSYADSLITILVKPDGSQRIEDVLYDVSTKLVILYEAAHEQVFAPPPETVIASLRAIVGAHGEMTDPAVVCATYREVVATSIASIDIRGYIDKRIDDSMLDDDDFITGGIKFREKFIEKEIRKRARQFGEGRGRKYGLWK